MKIQPTQNIIEPKIITSEIGQRMLLCITYAGIACYYAENQTEHHRKKSLKEELIEFLTEHGVVYDEKYL